MKNHNRTIIISFMGVDGSGKSTLIELLRMKLIIKVLKFIMFQKIEFILI